MKTKIGFIAWVVCIVIACNTQPKGVKVKLVNNMPNYEIVKIRIGTSYYLCNNDSLHQQEFYFNSSLKEGQDIPVTFKYFNKYRLEGDFYFASDTDTVLVSRRTDMFFNPIVNSGKFACLLSFDKSKTTPSERGPKSTYLIYTLIEEKE